MTTGEWGMETTKPFSDDWIRLKCATRRWAHSCGVGFVSGWKFGIWIRRAAFNEISGATTSLNLRFMRINGCRFHWPISRTWRLRARLEPRRWMHSASCTPVALRMASMDLWPSLWRHRETTGSSFFIWQEWEFHSYQKLCYDHLGQSHCMGQWFFIAHFFYKDWDIEPNRSHQAFDNDGGLEALSCVRREWTQVGSFNAALNIFKALKFRICISLSKYLVTSRILSPTCGLDYLTWHPKNPKPISKQKT